jgi:hypothetical protein
MSSGWLLKNELHVQGGGGGDKKLRKYKTSSVWRRNVYFYFILNINCNICGSHGCVY